MNLTEIIRSIEELKRQRQSVVLVYDRKLKAIDDKLSALYVSKSLHGNGIDLEKVELAETVLKIEGDPGRVVNGSYSDQNRGGVRAQAINDAIAWLALDGGKRLAEQYVGVKNYSGFGDQREDHQYGYGPRHGQIVFRIGRIVRDRDLTEAEVEAAIYYLNSIHAIHASKAAA